MCGLKEELLGDQFETSLVEGDICDPSEVEEQGDPEFILTSMFPDQVSLGFYYFDISLNNFLMMKLC